MWQITPGYERLVSNKGSIIFLNLILGWKKSVRFEKDSTPRCQLLEHRKFPSVFPWLHILFLFLHPSLYTAHYLCLPVPNSPLLLLLWADIHRPRGNGAVQVVCNRFHNGQRDSLFYSVLPS